MPVVLRPGPPRPTLRSVSGWGCLVLALLAGLGSVGSSSAAADASRGPVVVRPPALRAATCGGHVIRPASVAVGDCLVVTASGFSPGASVVARLLSASTKTAVLRGDRAGVVRYRWVVAARETGEPDVLTLVQATPAEAPVAATSANLLATVPRFTVWRFQVSLRRP